MREDCMAYMQILHNFITGTWASPDFGIPRDPGTISSWILRGDYTSFKASTSILKVLDAITSKSQHLSGPHNTDVFFTHVGIQSGIPSSFYPLRLPLYCNSAMPWGLNPLWIHPTEREREHKETQMLRRALFWKRCPSILLTFHWLELSHMAPSYRKRGGEMFGHAPSKKRNTHIAVSSLAGFIIPILQIGNRGSETLSELAKVTQITGTGNQIHMIKQSRRFFY